MFEHLKQMNAEMAEFKKTYLEKSKAAFYEIAKQLFEKHNCLVSFSWTQYTPYFNDGDECIFSANTDDPDLNGVGSYEDGSRNTKYEKVDGVYKDVPNPDYKPEIAAARHDVEEFLRQFDDAVYRDLFGDHKIIKVTSSGTEVEDYDHD